MKRSLTLTCGTVSLVGKEGCPVKLDIDGTVLICAAAADEAIGVLDRGAGIGSDVDVCVHGDSATGLQVTGKIYRGQVATINAAGTGFTGGKTDAATFVGRFTQNGVSGDYVPAFIFAPIKHKA